MDIGSLSDKEYEEKLALLLSEHKTRMECPFYKMFPKTGDYAWDKYPKHQEFLEATNTSNICYFKAANRIGKSSFVVWMLRAHATGEYPEIWTGRKFDRPLEIWVIGVTHAQVREVTQKMLVESALTNGDGGFLPQQLIVNKSLKQKPMGAYLDLWIRHIPTGGVSHIMFKCYEQMPDDFQGAKVDVILFDEEPPSPIFDECLLRTMSGVKDGQSGLIMIAATPKHGPTKFVQSFKDKTNKNRKCIVATWDDVPHISQEEKEQMLQDMEPHMREARSRGIEYMGSGLVFPVAPHRYTCKPIITIPRHWQLINGLDPGPVTAAIFGAADPVTKTLYIYGEKRFTDVPVPIKARALADISQAPYMADTSLKGRDEMDQRQLNTEYIKCGLDLQWPNKKLKETYIAIAYRMMLAGQIQISNECTSLLDGLGSYHRDETGIQKV
jgi:phage terminase large subunit-like protein